MPPAPLATALAALAVLAVFAACSGSERTPPPDLHASAAMRNAPLVHLDEVLRVAFAGPLDPASIDERTVQLVAVDGPGLGLPARGTWRLASEGHVAANALEFVPDLPLHEPVPTSGGLQPDTGYELRITGGDGGVVVRGADGRPLAEPLLFRLRTRAGTTASELFTSDLPGGPRFTDLAVTPRSSEGDWRLGRSNAAAELRIHFDQPLDPSGDNLPRAPTATARGPIELVYDDPEYGAGTWVAADVELERNTADGATVLLRPRGVLPSAATLRLRIQTTLRDLRGEDRSNTSEPVPTAEVRTEAAIAPQFDTVLQDFQSGAASGNADFAEVPAVVADGALRVPDTFPAVEGVGDWSPTGPEVILRTDEQTLYYTSGAPRTFAGGVLHVKNLHIAAGTLVTGRGTHPLVLVVDGDARIDGTLSVDGSNGRLDSMGQYRGPGEVVPPYSGPGVPEPYVPQFVGALGGPGGGHGGRSSNLQRSPVGSRGGPSTLAAQNGGGGGSLACAACTRGSGAGGGAMAVQGDPWFPTPAAAGTSFVQRAGNGGYGCEGASGAAARALVGGRAGTPLFANADAADDFWGAAYEPRTHRRLVGELGLPSGGGGGGSGGDLAWNSSCDPADPLGVVDYRGQDGAGGGGVLVLQVRGTLTVGAAGRITANGGSAWSGQPRVGFNIGQGGGGGGAGGMVVLMAGRGIVIHAHGETFANRDYDFAISADGGVGHTRSFATPIIQGKYPANGQPTFAAVDYDSWPLGGFGGLGVIQLMVPVGTDNLDGTNTVLDDAITIVQNGVPLQGAGKQRFLGWRGLPDAQGTWVDDFGVPTNTAGGQGDMRPAPILMPAPFTTAGRARARSGWLPLGAVNRRSVAAPDGLPRAVVGEALQFGSAARSDGWLPYGTGPLAATAAPYLLPQPAVVVLTGTDTATFGRPVYVLELAAPLSEPDRYGGCVAELQRATGSRLGWLRVVGNRDERLFLEPETALPAAVDRVQLRAWFAELATPPPASYVGADLQPVPRANVRIGFAFHRAPEQAATVGIDPERFPTDVTAFVHDLTDPATSLALRAFGPTHLQWDVLLDGEFRRTPADVPPPADAQSQIAVRRFWLPVRY